MTTRATHGAPHDPSRLLRRANAPVELVAWTEGESIDTLWEQCDRGDWLIWLAVVERVPLVAMVTAAAACAERAARAMPGGRERLLRAIRAATELTSPEDCDVSARVCEAKADEPEAQSYRTSPASAYRWAAQAAALTARAAEGLLREEVARQGERAHEARARGAIVGAGDQIMAGPSLQPLTFDIDSDWSRFCVDAAANAVVAAVRALAPSQPTEDQIEQAEADLSELAFDILDPLRAAIREGADPRTLVDVVTVKPFAEVLSSNEDGITVDKQPMVAWLAALFVPIGGGHYYAEHRQLAAVLTSGIVGGFVASFAYPPALQGAVALVAFDLFTSPGAVRRRNQGKILGGGAQLMRGIAAIAVAALVALLAA